MPMVEEYVTLACVSNEVGGPLVGNALWLGVPLADVLDRAGVAAGADQIVGRSVDGFTAGFPTAVGPRRPHRAGRRRHERRAAARSSTASPPGSSCAGLYGYVSATKWLTEIELTRFGATTTLLGERGLDAEARSRPSRASTCPATGTTAGGRTPRRWPVWRGRRTAASPGRGAGRRRAVGRRHAGRRHQRRPRGGSGRSPGTPPPGATCCGCGPPTAPARCRRLSMRDPFPNAATGYHQIVANVT